MEAFTLLKYWHTLFTGDTTFTARPAALSDDDDDGPFFDMDFTLSQQNDDDEDDLFYEAHLVPNQPFSTAQKTDEKGPLVSLFAKDNYSSANLGMQDSDRNEKKLSKEVVQKYFKMLKMKTGNTNSNNLQSGLKVVFKHLGKSRSASAASPPSGNRRDDSLADGIEGAILHCKRSFNASADGESAAVLSRSVSDPSHDKIL